MVIAAQFFRYVVVGVMNVAFDFFLFNLLSISLGIYSGPAIIAINSLAGSVVLVHSFFWNKFWTFRKPGGAMLGEFAKFVMVNLGSIVLNSGIVFAVTTYFPPFPGSRRWPGRIWPNLQPSASTSSGTSPGSNGSFSTNCPTVSPNKGNTLI